MDDSQNEDDNVDLFYMRNQGDSSDKKFDDKENLNSILETLNEKYSKIVNCISTVINKKVGTRGIWNPDQRLVHIVSEKQTKQYIPYMRENIKCLSPFEALFLLECRSLTLFYRNISLSIEDAYQLLLQGNRDLKLYKIFSTLSRVGYYVYQIDKDKETPEYQMVNENQLSADYVNKRSIDPDQLEISLQYKKINSTSEKSNVNYHAINNIRSLKLSSIPKVNKTDKELIQHFRNEENLKSFKPYSYLYCVKKSSRPINISPLLCPLYDQKTKPLIPLGSIYDTDHLFETIQKEAPINADLLEFNNSNNENKMKFNVDFFVYSSLKQMNNSERKLFSVVVVDEDQLPPSIEEIRILNHNSQNNPIVFALLSQSLNVNFYSFEKLKIKNKYPRLWEQHYEC